MVWRAVVCFLFAIAALTAACESSHARGVGGYHGGGGRIGNFNGLNIGSAAAFRGYHGGFGVGGMYEGALDGPAGFSGYGTNWSGYRGGYGVNSHYGFQGGYGLGYGRGDGMAGFNNFNRPGPWSRGVAGWRGELGQGGGYENLGYGFNGQRMSEIRAGQYGALSRIPGYLQGPGLEGLQLPTDIGLHQAEGIEHRAGYSGSANGLTAFDAGLQNLERRDPTPLARQDYAAARNEAAVTRYRTDADLRSHGHTIRNAIVEAADGPSVFDDWATGWIAANMASDLWTPAPWTTVNSWFGNNWPAIGYNYGQDLTYNNNEVYLYGEPMATAAEYYQAAVSLARRGNQDPPKNVEWLPLGVFAAVRSDEKTSNMFFQISVDKAGAVRGNYFNPTDKNVQPISGAVDRKTQRVAWSVADRPNIVFDTGVYNLTKDESPVLVHFSKDKTEQWTFVRLKKSKAKTSKK